MIGSFFQSKLGKKYFALVQGPVNGSELHRKIPAIPPPRGWSGGAMVLGKLPVPGCPTIWITVGQGLTALAVGAGGCCLASFILIYLFFLLSPSL